jgi:signal transduction histidine kinase
MPADRQRGDPLCCCVVTSTATVDSHLETPRSTEPSRRSEVGPRRAAIVIALIGTGAAIVTAFVTTMSRTDAFELIALAAAAGLVAGLAGLGVLRLLRSASVAWQAAAISCTSAMAAMLGAWAGAQLMFLSSHDLAVLQILLLSGGTAACVLSLVLGDRWARGSVGLVDATRRLGSGQHPTVDGATTGSPELAAVARELALTSDKLTEARRRERLLEQSRRELIAWISHDLRDPVADIHGALDDLAGRVGDEHDDALARHVALVRKQAVHLEELLDDLIEVSTPSEPPS